MKRSLTITGLLLTFASGMAGRVNISASATGSAGNWDIEFLLNNNSGDNNLYLYFFGVDFAPHSVVGAPTNWDGNVFGDSNPWNPFQNEGAGPNKDFVNCWIDSDGTDQFAVSNGESLGNFKIHSDLENLPSTAEYFVYGLDWSNGYDGGDSFSGEDRKHLNPGFAGRVDVTVVPEPAAIASLGLFAVALLKRRR